MSHHRTRSHTATSILRDPLRVAVDVALECIPESRVVVTGAEDGDVVADKTRGRLAKCFDIMIRFNQEPLSIVQANRNLHPSLIGVILGSGRLL